jgi:glycosyltransferase involved in cell wall biosynthesis
MADHGGYERMESGRKLRVALFSGNYNYVVDGPSKALNRFVAHLEAKGHEALVFAPTSRTPAFKHSGTLISIPSTPLPGNRKEFRLAFGLPGFAKKRLDAFKPDIVHLSAPDWLGYEALNYARSRGVPAVASFHTRFDTYPRFYGARWLEPYVTDYLRHFYGRCVHVYAPAQSMADELKRDGIGRDIRIWTRGVDGALFNPKKRDMAWRRSLGFADDDVVALFVGRVVLEKSIDVFSEAVIAASKGNPKIRALVVGEGPERARFAALLPTGVFTGHQDGEDLARAYASADIFFNPSITETFGNVTLEAMASGLACVCAAASGSVSLVEDGVNGLLVPPAEGAQGYPGALTKLAEDQALRRAMGAKGREKSHEFAWPVILDGLIDHYRQAIATYAQAPVGAAA